MGNTFVRLTEQLPQSNSNKYSPQADALSIFRLYPKSEYVLFFCLPQINNPGI
jgi:hypothetical protein